MIFKRISLLLALARPAALSAATAVSGSPGNASLVIRHQTRGCHSWSVERRPVQGKPDVTLRHGGPLTVTDNDVMPHTLVLTSGPALRIAHPKLGHPGASLTITLTKPRRLSLHDEGRRGLHGRLKTIGEDNVLADGRRLLMHTSYGVVWRDGEGPLARGKLELLPRAVRLEGLTGTEPTTREIAYDYLSEIRVGRSTEERIDGRPSLVLEPRSGETISIASVAQAGVVAELAERLAELQLGAEGPHRIAVVGTDPSRGA